MKILIYSPDVFSVFFPETHFIFGGVETEIFLTATALSDIYHEKVIVLTRDQGLGEKEFRNTEVTPYPFLKGEGYWAWRKTLGGRIMHRLFGEKMKWESPAEFFNNIDPDIIYVQGLHKHCLELARYAKEKNKKLIFKGAHDMDFGGEKNDLVEIAKWTNQPPGYLEELYSLPDLMLVQTPFQQRLLKERFGRDAEIVLNPIALDESPGTHEKKYDVLWVGKTNFFKRPELLFQLANALPRLRFCMICNKFDAAPFEMLKKNIPANVEFIESVPADKIGAYFAAARVFVSTSIHEGFANTFLQAARYGVPVISMNSNPNNMLTEGRAGIVVDDDIDQCRKEIGLLLEDSSRYKKLSEGAFAYVKSHHDIRVILARVHKIMQELYSQAVPAL